MNMSFFSLLAWSDCNFCLVGTLSPSSGLTNEANHLLEKVTQKWTEGGIWPALLSNWLSVHLGSEELNPFIVEPSENCTKSWGSGTHPWLWVSTQPRGSWTDTLQQGQGTFFLPRAIWIFITETGHREASTYIYITWIHKDHFYKILNIAKVTL